MDNASADGSAHAVAERFPQVVLIANTDNTGYAEGNNQAMERAKGAYILLLNPDVILPPRGLERAVAFMEATYRTRARWAYGRSIPDGKMQRSVRGFPSPLAVLWELLGLSRLLPQQPVLRRVPDDLVRLCACRGGGSADGNVSADAARRRWSRSD